MTHPDDATVVRVCAERDGWTLATGEVYKWERKCGSGIEVMFEDDEDVSITERCYLHSTDAIRPVVAKLTPEERDYFLHLITGNAEGAEWLSFEQLWYCLTLPPDQLARAVAEAIQLDKRIKALEKQKGPNP